jgi:hypothetical protein
MQPKLEPDSKIAETDIMAGGKIFIVLAALLVASGACSAQALHGS